MTTRMISGTGTATLGATLMGAISCQAATDRSISGPLHVSRDNPRYFADAEGRVVYLTGSHTWRP